MSDEQLQRLVGRSVTVSVPATIANLGVGYDVLGMAIDERNELSVRVSGLAASGALGEVTLEVRGEGLGELPVDRRNVAVGAVVRGLEIGRAHV